MQPNPGRVRAGAERLIGLCGWGPCRLQIMRKSLGRGRRLHMLRMYRLLSPAILVVALAGPLVGQGTGAPLQLPAAQTGCDTSQRIIPDFVNESDTVEAARLPIEGMPLWMREVVSAGRVFRRRRAFGPDRPVQH